MQEVRLPWQIDSGAQGVAVRTTRQPSVHPLSVLVGTEPPLRTPFSGRPSSPVSGSLVSGVRWRKSVLPLYCPRTGRVDERSRRGLGVSRSRMTWVMWSNLVDFDRCQVSLPLK